MADWRRQKSSLTEKLNFFVCGNGDLGDVTFLVGPHEEPIKAFRLVLMAQSPVFETMLSDRWKGHQQNSPINLKQEPEPDPDDEQRRREQEQQQAEKLEQQQQAILLPDCHPKAFRAFLKLLLTDDLKAENLAALNMSTDDVMHLLYMSKKYQCFEIKKICEEYLKKETTVLNALAIYDNVRNLEEDKLQQETFNFMVKNIKHIVQQKEFVCISKDCLAKILRNNDVAIDELHLFEAAYSWAKFQCAKEGMEGTGENIRNMLGDCLYLIRFPLISPPAFANSVYPKNILNDKEALALYTYMARTEKDKKKAVSVKDLGFSSKKRTGGAEVKKSPARSKLICENVTLSTGVDNPSYDCRSAQHYITLMVDQRIQLYSFGFLGPLEEDSAYDVTIKVGKIGGFYIQSKVATVFAQKKSIFHVAFTKPVAMEPGSWYCLYFSLEGAPTQSTQVTGSSSVVSRDGITFSFNHQCYRQLCEIRYGRTTT